MCASGPPNAVTPAGRTAVPRSRSRSCMTGPGPGENHRRNLGGRAPRRPAIAPPRGAMTRAIPAEIGGKYRIVRRLGQGAMGSVFEAIKKCSCSSHSPVLAHARRLHPPFEELFHEHAPYAGRVLRNLGVSEADLPDALQEAFLVVHRKLSGFAPNRAFAPGSTASACALPPRTAGARTAAARWRSKKVPLDAAGAPAPDEEAEHRQALARLDAALDELDEQKREVFVLYEIEGADIGRDRARARSASAHRLFAAHRRAQSGPGHVQGGWRRDGGRYRLMGTHRDPPRLVHGSDATLSRALRAALSRVPPMWSSPQSLRSCRPGLPGGGGGASGAVAGSRRRRPCGRRADRCGARRHRQRRVAIRPEKPGAAAIAPAMIAPSTSASA